MDGSAFNDGSRFVPKAIIDGPANEDRRSNQRLVPSALVLGRQGGAATMPGYTETFSSGRLLGTGQAPTERTQQQGVRARK